MTRETKVGLLIGMGVILLIGIIVSDTLSVARQDAPDLTGYADQSQDSIFQPGESDTRFSRSDEQRNTPDLSPTRRRPVPTPDELRNPGTADDTSESDRRREAPPMQRQLPTALSLDEDQPEQGSQRTARDQVPTLSLSHDALLPANQQRDRAADSQANRQTEPQPQTRDADSTRTDDRTPASNQTIHYVKRGETLYDIARNYYGSGSLWRKLAEFNDDTVGSDGRVVEDARLVIPPRELLEQSNRFAAAGSERSVRVTNASNTRSEARTVTVGSGDTLSDLADEHLGSSNRWRDLLEANRDKLETATDLQAGMKLKLPGREAGSDNASDNASRTADRRADDTRSTSSEYTVRTGDTLTRIARRVLDDPDRWNDIYQANRDKLASPDSLKVGQTLRIP